MASGHMINEHKENGNKKRGIGIHLFSKSVPQQHHFQPEKEMANLLNMSTYCSKV